MSGEIEAAGELTTGVLIARAFESRAGEGLRGGDHGGSGACLNCGTALIGDHCHACGQPGHVHRSLGAIFHDLAHSVFHFDGKLWRTLPMLVFHPGELTRRYINGERARFVSPLAMFLFTVFLMFAIVGSLAPSNFVDGFNDGLANVDSELAEGRSEIEADLARLMRDRAATVARSRDTTKIDAEIATRQNDLKAHDTLAELKSNSNGSIVQSDVKTGWSRLDKGLEKAAKNPGLIAYKVQGNAYKFSWALILLSTPFVALIFLWRRRFHMYDHAIFVTYSITFMSLLVITLSVAVSLNLPEGLFAPAILLVPPIHIYKQIRGAYSLKRSSALWFALALSMFAIIAMMTFVIGLIMLGLLG